MKTKTIPQKIGVKFTPQFIGTFVREGSSIASSVLSAHAIGKEYKLCDYGFDSNNAIFYLIFELPNCPKLAKIKWIIPEYKRIARIA